MTRLTLILALLASLIGCAGAPTAPTMRTLTGASTTAPKAVAGALLAAAQTPATINGAKLTAGMTLPPGQWRIIAPSGSLTVIGKPSGTPHGWSKLGDLTITVPAGRYAVSWKGGYVEVLAVASAPAKVRLAGIVLGWSTPDQPPAVKAEWTKKTGSPWGRWFIGVNRNTDAVAKARDSKALADAGILPVIMFHPSGAGAVDFWRSSPAAVAAKIHQIAPPGSVIALGNETASPSYWPNGDYKDSVIVCLAVADELWKLGRRELAAPCPTTPTATNAAKYVALVNQLDVNKRFTWLNVHSYSPAADYVRAFMSVYRAAADASGRKLLVDEWGLLPPISRTAFTAVAPIILEHADLSCLWLGWESAGQTSVALLDKSGNPTPFHADWLRLTGPPTTLYVLPSHLSPDRTLPAGATFAVTEQAFWLNRASNAVDLQSLETWIKATIPTSGLWVIDIEDVPLIGGGADDAQVRQRWAAIAKASKHVRTVRPDVKIGIYDVPTREYWPAVNYQTGIDAFARYTATGLVTAGWDAHKIDGVAKQVAGRWQLREAASYTADYRRWQDINNRLAFGGDGVYQPGDPIDAIDVVTPSAYLPYEVTEFGWAERTYVEHLLAEAFRVSRGKPVVLIISPLWEGRDERAAMPLAVWRGLVECIKAYRTADGRGVAGIFIFYAVLPRDAELVEAAR